MLRLNLASGTDIRDGWLNLDIVPKWPDAHRGCDIIWDARTDRLPFEDNVASEIYAGYLLLHLAPMHHSRVLADIRRVLAPSGTFRITEVDMQVVMTRFLSSPYDVRLAELIWGEQGQEGPTRRDKSYLPFAEFDKHCHGYTRESLVTTLSRAGFAGIHEIEKHIPEQIPSVFYQAVFECNKGT